MFHLGMPNRVRGRPTAPTRSTYDIAAVPFCDYSDSLLNAHQFTPMPDIRLVDRDINYLRGCYAADHQPHQLSPFINRSRLPWCSSFAVFVC